MAIGVTDRDEANVRARTTSCARQLLLQAILLGLLADSAMRNAQAGLGWTIWILGLAMATVIVLRQRGDRLNREQSAWLAVAVACAAAFAWRDAETVQAANAFGTLGALTLFAMSSARAPVASILSARVRDVVAATAYAARDALVGAPPLLFRDAALGSHIQASAAARWPALRAALLTVPIVIVFTGLLSRADPVFGSVFELPDIDIGNLVSHVLVAGAFAWVSAGWMRGALLGTAKRSSLPEQLPFRLGIVEITTSLGALVAIFAVFVGLQLRWLFGGADVVLATTGLSLAEYARRGFFELVTVAALVLPLILGTRAAIVDDASLGRHRQLSLSLLVLLGAIMASAMLRMRLYVMHFGLTTDRLYASVFMIWLALVFVSMALTVLRGWPRPFATMTVVSGFATLFALNAANPEAIVARVNLSRSAVPRAVDYAYLARLSGDAARVVAEALATADPSPNTCGSAKALRRRWLGREETRSNLGSMRGRTAVLELLTPPRVQRVCGFSGVQP